MYTKALRFLLRALFAGLLRQVLKMMSACPRASGRNSQRVTWLCRRLPAGQCARVCFNEVLF